MRSNHLILYSALLLAVLVAVMPPLVQAELDCTDFLTFSYPGHTKLPADAFDYNTSIRVLRVSSGRLDSFAFADAEKGYFFVALSPYEKTKGSRSERNVSVGQVLYQYTPGSTEYYYRVMNGSSLSWYCNLEKMADLTVTVETLSGSFYSAGGENLNLTSAQVLSFDAGVDDGFLVPGFGTVRRFYVGLSDDVSGLPVGYVIFDAGNATYFATGYKQARFHVPASKTPFCTNFASFCLDAAGTHASVCKGSGFLTYSCGNNQCIGNLTACKYGCEQSACLEATPTPSSSVEATVAPSASAAAPSISATAIPSIPSATPKSDSGVSTAVGVIVLLFLIAGAYLLFFRTRRPKGL